MNAIQINVKPGPATPLVADQRNDLPPDGSLLLRFFNHPMTKTVIVSIAAALCAASFICVVTAASLGSFPLAMVGTGLGLAGLCVVLPTAIADLKTYMS